MSHHTHSMESRLSVKENIVSILKLSLGNGSVSHELHEIIAFELVHKDVIGIFLAFVLLDQVFYFTLST